MESKQLPLGDFANLPTGWSALDADTTGVAAAAAHVMGTESLEFDKSGTAAAIGGASTTISVNMDRRQYFPDDRVAMVINVPDLTNAAYAFVRLGTDASNYNEWRFADSDLTAARFTVVNQSIGNSFVTGNGWNVDSVVYLAAGVVFDAAANTLNNIQIDYIYLDYASFQS